jgi:putative FmdB family regulatory protein
VPYYDYQCSTCDSGFELFRPSMISSELETAPHCPHCASAETQRRVSRVAVLKQVSPGVGQAAYPTSWSATNHGDKDTIHYWRQRVEKEKSQESNDPGLKQERLISAERRYEEIVETTTSRSPAGVGAAPTPAPAQDPTHTGAHTHNHGPGGHTH